VDFTRKALAGFWKNSLGWQIHRGEKEVKTKKFTGFINIRNLKKCCS
jgi:hypothetical protein